MSNRDFVYWTAVERAKQHNAEPGGGQAFVINSVDLAEQLHITHEASGRECRRLNSRPDIALDSRSRGATIYTGLWYPEGKPGAPQEEYLPGDDLVAGCTTNVWDYLHNALDVPITQAWPLTEKKQKSIERKMRVLLRLMERDRECQHPSVR